MSHEQQATLVVEPNGCIRAIYSDQLSVHALGEVSIERASHVEPNELGLWWADLSPVGGPKLGPYLHRADALRCEVAWLEMFWLEPKCN